ncbi:phosphate ABC transporter substrate-binding protein PstS [Microbacterium sp. STN6]|uniref:phosphate ABC transporter substrate-binding protein PstS n=1 Tax=Microbacterium sp. STN6 TaxID=2995588 RepID=UPI00226103C7|nr:phosphate ABC transporter substrate-binding protein PstS [Microbacterium sp. STN6]MCX7523374.1 phosphate ABC transporter substrate-binding protein PstS [Microbacterium sp. STN6]
MTFTRFTASARITAPVAALAIATIALSGCAANERGTGAADAAPASALKGTLSAVGSSAQGAAETVWAAGFQTDNPDVTVNYDPQGSGAGRKSFISGAADFAGSDAALSDDELGGDFALCTPGSGAIDLPVYISPIAVAYNVDGVSDLRLDADTIAGIFKGSITRWNDKALTALNPDAKLPDAAITVVHRSDDSGTTQNFTEYLAANAKSVWDAPASQTFPYQVGDAAKGTSGVADATKSASNSITYVDESGSAGLSIAQLKVGDAFVTINAKGAAAVVAASPLKSGRADHDLAVDIDRTITDADAWPLVLVSYVIACQQYKDSAKADLVKAYAGYLATDAAQQASAEQTGSAPLSAELATKVQAAAASIK